MECLHLLTDSGGKICRRMIEQGLDGALDDFDITQYCKGNPNYCFFFRSYNNQIQTNLQPEANAPDVPTGFIVLNEPNQPDELTSKRSDKLLKLKRLLHRIV